MSQYLPYIEALNRETGLDIQLSASGGAQLMLEDRGVLLQWLEEQQMFIIYMELGPLSGWRDEEVLKQLLSANFLFLQTEGGSLSYNPSANMVGMNYASPVYGLSAEEFVRENPTSPVSRYLVSSLFVETAEPDHARAAALLAEMCKADPDNGRLALYRKQVDALKASVVGASVPQFSAKDIYGNTVTRAALGGKVNVVCTWASWSYESHGAVRRLCQLQKDYGSDLAVVGICLDARPAVCRSAVERDSIKWPNVCDGLMWQTPLLGRLGLSTVPGNIVADAKGKVVARNLSARLLSEQIKEMLEGKK